MGTTDFGQAPDSIERPLHELLRARLARPELDFAEKPTRLLGGNHTFVYTFRLSGAPDPWNRPLVLRMLRAHRVADEVVFESALQNALSPLAPRVLLSSPPRRRQRRIFAAYSLLSSSAPATAEMETGPWPWRLATRNRQRKPISSRASRCTSGRIGYCTHESRLTGHAEPAR